MSNGNAVREALRRLESAVDRHLGRSGFTQSTQLKGVQHTAAVRKELYAAHDAALAALAAVAAPVEAESVKVEAVGTPEFERIAKLLDAKGGVEEQYAAKILRTQAAWADRLTGERNAAHAALQELIPMFAAWHEEFPDDVGHKEGPALARARIALGAAATQAVDAYPALQALTEAVLTRADNDYMDRQIDAAVKVMAYRGWLPPVPWPRRDEGSPCPTSESTAIQARAAAPAVPAGLPLTPEHVLHLWDTHVGDLTAGTPLDTSDKLFFARAIEMAHGISPVQSHEAGKKPPSEADRTSGGGQVKS